MDNLHKLEPHSSRSRGDSSRGMALVTTLLLLTVMMAMTLAMVIAVTSDTLITKYYRNARTAFYGGDSGVNIARTAMENSLSSAAFSVGQTFTSGTVPILTGSDMSTALSTVSNYTTATSILGGQAANSWPSSFTIVASQSGTMGTNLAGCALGTTTCTLSTLCGTGSTTCTATSPSCSAVANHATTSAGVSDPGPFDCGSVWGGTHPPQCTGSCSGFTATVTYTIPYTITALGQSIASEKQIVEDEGTILLNATFGTQAAYQQSFAGWGMFIDQYQICSGDLVAGTISGPVFTNGAWTFGNGGAYTFTGSVGSVSSQFGWDQGGRSGCSGSATYPQPGFSTTFDSTVSLGANSVPLPSNDFSQKEAVVDGLGSAGTVSNAQMNASLKTESSTAYPSAGTTNPGVYLPYTNTTSSSCPTAPCMTGGGIYVEGSANSVVLSTNSPVISGVTHNQQVFTITQGSGTTTTTTVTVDLTSNTTTFASQVGTGTIATKTINGVPDNLAGSSPSEAVMLYVDGSINSLSGPSSGPAIANGSAVTIDAGSGNNMTITGNITYATEPVTLTQNGSTPADTLIAGNNSGQVLGLYTAGGQINMSPQTNNQNLEIDASIASIVSGGSGGLQITGSNSINTLTIVGGRIQNAIENIGATTRNVWFDQRFASGNFAPPWFPSTTVTPVNTNAVNGVTSKVSRTEWLSAY